MMNATRVLNDLAVAGSSGGAHHTMMNTYLVLRDRR